MSLLDHPPPVPFDPSSASDDELLSELDALEAAQRRLDAQRVALLAEADGRAVTERSAGLRLKAYLGHSHHVSPAMAARQVATAKKLRVLPAIAHALELGWISFDHAALLARLCTPRVEAIMVELQDRFNELALIERFEQWAHDVRALISLADQDGPGPGPLGEPTNRLRMTDGLDGALHLDIDLVGPAAAKVRASLLKEAQRRYRAHHRNHPEVPDGAGGTTDHDTDGPGVSGVRGASDGCVEAASSFEQFPGRGELLAEALVELIGKGVVEIAGNKRPATDVSLIVPASGPIQGWTPDGVRLQDRTVRQLLCNSIFHAVVVDHLGVPVDLGESARFFSPHQQRAVMVRDGGCGHPGCPMPVKDCEIHHVLEWDADDGPSDLDNALPACWFHHGLWHSEGWSVAPDPDTHPLDQGFIITNPTVTSSARNATATPDPSSPHSASTTEHTDDWAHRRLGTPTTEHTDAGHAEV